MSRWPGRLITKTPVTPGGSSPTASAPGVWTLPEMAYWKKQGLWPDASADAYWGYVSFLLSTSSLSNANNNLFVDSSSAFSPVSRNGNPTQGTQTPYGTLWSNYLDGSSYLSAPANSAFAFGTGDFTVECWVNFMPGSASGRITNRNPGGGASGTWGFNISPTTFAFTEVVAGEPGVSASGLPNMTNAWVHLAACRSGSTLRLFANGVLVGSGSNTTNFNNSSYGLGIGAAYETAITGYMSNVRIVKGTALYTAAFTPPVAPLTAISGTSLLTCQSNRFRDSSSNAFAITLTGTPRVTPYSPFILNGPGAVYNQSDISYWSGYFDGTSDSLSYTGGSSIAFGTSDFTIELWAYLTNTGTYSPFLRPDDSGVFPEFGYDFSSGQLKFDARNGAIVAVTTTMPTSQWVHVAACRSGTNLRLFINGSQVGTTTTNSTNFATTTGAIRIGGSSFSASHTVNGYLSNFRVINGTALYTTTFTPPTAPLTAVSGTSLLTLQNAAFTDNSTNNFVLTPNGNTTVTGNNPFQAGYYSNYFDGSGDYLTAPASSSWIFSGDYTLEAWVYPTVSGADMQISGTGGSGSNDQFGITSGVGTGRVYWAYAAVGNYLTTTATIPANAWTHIAVTRSSNTLRAFVNGVQVFSGTMSTTVGQNATNYIGRRSDGFNSFTGYMSNLRLVNGTAVYTSAFTPSTTPLTAITNTSLLTCQAARLIDSSANNFTITKNGDVAVSPFDPFLSAVSPTGASGSGYFDGTSTSSALTIGTPIPATSDFTIQFWYYLDSTSVAAGTATLIPLFNNFNWYNQNDLGIFIGYNVSTGNIEATVATGGGTSVSPPKTDFAVAANCLGRWTHIALVRSGATVRLFVNGAVTSGTLSSNTGLNVATRPFNVGGWYAFQSNSPTTTRYAKGYISNLSIDTTALYSAAFTPPTAPVTATTSTTRLLNFTNGGIYDAAMQNDIETVGNAQVSSAQAKYGTTSAYFDGSGDVLTAPTIPSYTLGTSDFTIEFWINAAASGVYQPVISYRNSGVVSAEPDFFVWNTNVGVWYVNGTAVITGTTNLSTAGWAHIAICRSSGSTRMFVNGVQEGSTYADTNNYLPANTSLKIGGLPGAGLYFTGYLDDVRITRGYARYTANFTPPTAALPVY